MANETEQRQESWIGLTAQALREAGFTDVRVGRDGLYPYVLGTPPGGREAVAFRAAGALADWFATPRAKRKASFVRRVGQYQELHRDRKTGIAWVENGATGLGHSCHSNIDASGSVPGMKDRGYWGRKDRTVRSHGYIFNTSSLVYNREDPFDVIAAEACECVGCRERRKQASPQG